MNRRGSTDKTPLQEHHPFGLLGRVEREVDDLAMTRNPIFSRKTPRLAVGFTLLELLVVITIIIVLVAIGFPLVKNMRSSAERTQCMTKLREWGIAIGGYAADHDGKVAWQQWPSISHDPGICSPYVFYWSGDGTVEAGFAGQLDHRHCPSVDWSGQGNPPVCYATIQPQGVEAKSYKDRTSGNTSDYPLAKIDNPSRFMLMIDATGSGYSVSSAEDFERKVKPLTIEGADLRHNHKVNALLADFSVRTMNWAEIEKGLKHWTTFEATVRRR
jgi:prepilin-type processing-associated H-X9-DG protein